MPDRYHEAGKRLDEWEQTAKDAGAAEWLAASDNKRRDGIALVGLKSMRGQGAAGCIAVLAGSGDAVKSRHANACHMATFDPATMLRLIRALRHLIATARPRDTDRIIDAILGSDE